MVEFGMSPETFLIGTVMFLVSLPFIYVIGCAAFGPVDDDDEETRSMIEPLNPPPAPPPDPPRRPMLVYVAGASREIDRARRVILELRTRGFEIAHDWPADVDANDGMANEGLSAEKRDLYASADIRAVADCDVFMLLVPSATTIGAWVELGAAIVSGRSLVLASGLDEDFERSIFTALAARRFSCAWGGAAPRVHTQQTMDDLAVSWLDGWAAARATTLEAAE